MSRIGRVLDASDPRIESKSTHTTRSDEVRPGRKVEVVIGGNREAPMSRAAARTVLREIRAAGPEKSARLFGQKIGSCGRCGRTLTDEHSRAVGIGPTCEGKGW
jgi:hypothetical protein